MPPPTSANGVEIPKPPKKLLADGVIAEAAELIPLLAEPNKSAKNLSTVVCAEPVLVVEVVAPVGFVGVVFLICVAIEPLDCAGVLPCAVGEIKPPFELLEGFELLTIVNFCGY